jgi:hypothetical protein
VILVHKANKEKKGQLVLQGNRVNRVTPVKEESRDNRE